MHERMSLPVSARRLDLSAKPPQIPKPDLKMPEINHKKRETTDVWIETAQSKIEDEDF